MYSDDDQPLDYGAPVTPPEDEQRLYHHPGFVFSGANMGGQSLHCCQGCGALVQDDRTVAHREWHEFMGG